MVCSLFPLRFPAAQSGETSSPYASVAASEAEALSRRGGTSTTGSAASALSPVPTSPESFPVTEDSDGRGEGGPTVEPLCRLQLGRSVAVGCVNHRAALFLAMAALRLCAVTDGRVATGGAILVSESVANARSP
jgi:hypothetical protein